MTRAEARNEALRFYGQPSSRFHTAGPNEAEQELAELARAIIRRLPTIHEPTHARKLAAKAIREIEIAWNNLDGVA